MGFVFSLSMLIPVLMFGITSAVIVVIANADRKHRQQQLTDNSPAVTLPVRLVKKQTFVNQSQVGVPLRHFLTFSSQDGSLIELEVPAEAYEAFNEGEYGDLCVQGRTFLGFAPQALPFAEQPFDAQLPQADPNQYGNMNGTMNGNFPPDGGFGQGMM